MACWTRWARSRRTTTVRTCPPLSGHGYREALAVLAGELSLDDAVAITTRHTRQYAKRQMTWFRRDRRILWLDAGDGPAADLADAGSGAGPPPDGVTRDA